MASSINSIKLVTNMLRKRLTFTIGLPELYKPFINRHKDTLIELIEEKAEAASQSNIARKLREIKGYYTLEMAPPTTGSDMKKLRDDIFLAQDFIKNGCYRYLTVKQAWLLLLVVTEVGLWFFLGETIGKMHLVGYKVD